MRLGVGVIGTGVMGAEHARLSSGAGFGMPMRAGNCMCAVCSGLYRCRSLIGSEEVLAVVALPDATYALACTAAEGTDR